MQLDWMIPGYLAGSVRPVTSVEPGAELRWLWDQGIRQLVQLGETPLDEADAPAELEIVHFPMEDVGIPPTGATADLCRRMIGSILAGRPVAVNGGVGTRRTATVLACCLVAWRGHADDALAIVQAIGPAYAPTSAQVSFVHRFEMELRSPWSRPAADQPSPAEAEADAWPTQGAPRLSRSVSKTA